MSRNNLVAAEQYQESRTRVSGVTPAFFLFLNSVKSFLNVTKNLTFKKDVIYVFPELINLSVK